LGDAIDETPIPGRPLVTEEDPDPGGTGGWRDHQQRERKGQPILHPRFDRWQLSTLLDRPAQQKQRGSENREADQQHGKHEQRIPRVAAAITRACYGATRDHSQSNAQDYWNKPT
jgi:hypothetical protein